MGETPGLETPDCELSMNVLMSALVTKTTEPNIVKFVGFVL